MKNIMLICNSDKSRIRNKEELKLDGMYVPCVNALGTDKYNIYAGMNCNIESDIYDKDCIHFYNQNVFRSLTAFRDNKKAFDNINSIIKNYNIDVIHCNTPIGGFLGRICGHKNKTNKVIYTAHGFHFFKGNSFIKNFIFKNVEKYLAHFTDAIITMNHEDYEEAQKFRLRNNGKVYFIHGIGINLQDYKNINVNVEKKRKELGLLDDDIVLISMGDLIKRKNYALSLEIIFACNNPHIKYLICGKGPELELLKKQAINLGIDNQVIFLGFRTDIKELLQISDIFLFTTLQEGLPRSLMEAMASGLPCVVSNIRGNKDLIDNNKGGYCCNNVNDYVFAINKLINDKETCKSFGKYNINRIIKYDINYVTKEMKRIYKDIGI